MVVLLNQELEGIWEFMLFSSVFVWKWNNTSTLVQTDWFGLFIGISTSMDYLMPTPSLFKNRAGRDMRVHAFFKRISLKVNVIPRMWFELTYYVWYCSSARYPLRHGSSPSLNSQGRYTQCIKRYFLLHSLAFNSLTLVSLTLVAVSLKVLSDMVWSCTVIFVSYIQIRPLE